MAKKEITNNQVVEILRKEIGFSEKRLTKKIDMDVEFLARITQDEFRKADKKHKQAHRIIRERIKDNESEINGVRKIATQKVKRDDRQDVKIKLITKRVKVLEKQVL